VFFVFVQHNRYHCVLFPTHAWGEVLKNDNPFIIPTSIAIPSLFAQPSYPTVPLEHLQTEGVLKENRDSDWLELSCQGQALQ
jgi:hypothetical protein